MFLSSNTVIVDIVTPESPSIVKRDPVEVLFFSLCPQLENVQNNFSLQGNLVGRDVHETTVNVKGRMVRIPNYLCASVRLPAAKEEPGAPAAAQKKNMRNSKKE